MSLPNVDRGSPTFSYAVIGLDDPSNVFHPRLQGGAGEVPRTGPGIRQGLRFLKPVYGVGGAMREGQPMSAESIETVG